MTPTIPPAVDSPPLLAIVIPTWNEEKSLPGLLSDLGSLDVPNEIVVSDGGSTDATVAIARTRGAVVVQSARGRGSQLRAGAEASQAQLLCFLHADVRLSPDSVQRLASLARRPPREACTFRLLIDAPGAGYRIIEWGTNWRSRWLGFPFGDQGLVIERASYERVGGHPSLPLMEDVALIGQLRRNPGVRTLRESVLVSARRWEKDGLLRRTLANWMLLARYLGGADPARLARRYEPPAPPR